MPPKSSKPPASGRKANHDPEFKVLGPMEEPDWDAMRAEYKAQQAKKKEKLNSVRNRIKEISKKITEMDRRKEQYKQRGMKQKSEECSYVCEALRFKLEELRERNYDDSYASASELGSDYEVKSDTEIESKTAKQTEQKKQTVSSKSTKRRRDEAPSVVFPSDVSNSAASAKKSKLSVPSNPVPVTKRKQTVVEEEVIVID